MDNIHNTQISNVKIILKLFEAIYLVNSSIRVLSVICTIKGKIILLEVGTGLYKE